VPLTVFAVDRLVHCPVSVDALLLKRPTELRVLHVEPAVLRPPGDAEASLIGEGQHYHPLRPLLWELALRGARSTLLPEIAGQVAYRVAPGVDLSGLRVAGALPAAIQKLQGDRYTLREMSDWPGFDTARASRLLNALYLQSGLIVSRTRPTGFGESSWAARRRTCRANGFPGLPSVPALPSVPSRSARSAPASARAPADRRRRWRCR
jgi:hypothetical protein